MKVAVSGTTGHVGAAVIRELHARDFKVRALVRGANTPSCRGLPIELVQGDVLDPRSLISLMEGCEALIHCAGVISVHGDPRGVVHRTNVTGTRNIFEAASQCGIRRAIHISSVHVFDQSPIHEVLDENRTLVDNYAIAYDRSKRAGQEVALAASMNQMESLVINPTGIIGPYDFKPSRTGKALLDLMTGRVPFMIDGGFDFCDSRDAAHAIVNALTMGRPGESYILSGRWYGMTEIKSMLENITGKRIRALTLTPKIASVGIRLAEAAARIARKEPQFTSEALNIMLKGSKNISSEKARRELNYRSRSLEDTLQDTCQWFLENGFMR